MDMTRHEARRGTLVLWGMAALATSVHLLVNGLGGYGYFRDELYYIACSQHLAAGYVDHPSFSILVMAAVRLVVGESVFAIRLVPALLAGLATALVGGLARRLGGAPLAVAMSALAFIVSPYVMSFYAYYSMNSFDSLFWLLAVHALVGLVEEPGVRRWLWLGLVLGLGLSNKTSVLWLGAGIAVAAVVSPRLRRQYATAGPYAAGALACLLFSPFLFWNAVHGWPHLEFMRNALAGKYAALTRGQFVVDQFLAMSPFTFLVSMPGLVWAIGSGGDERRRVIGVTFLTVFVVLLANSHTKAEYMAAAYPMLFACGGVALDQWRRPWRAAAAWGVTGLLAASGAAFAPLAMPILPVDAFVAYARHFRLGPGPAEAKKMGDLPSFFADMQGWEELAREVSAAYLAIPEAERATTVAFVSNYGEAGALQRFAGKYTLPRVICTHNAYWFWGPGPMPVTTFIRLGGEAGDYREHYGRVTQVGVHPCAHCMPYESDLKIFVVRDRHVPIDRAWATYKHFD
jgi:hypothetical protein